MATLYGPLALCSASLASVVARREQAGAASAGLGKILLGLILIGVPFLPVLIGVGLGLSMLLSGEDISLGIELMPVLLPIGLGFVFFLTFGIWGIRTVLAGLRERRAFRTGVRTTARVLGARPTGVRINDLPEMLIELEVALDPPVRSQLRRVVHPGEQHVLAPGTQIFVRVDPKDPSAVIPDR
jgi:hypothetical protein